MLITIYGYGLRAFQVSLYHGQPREAHALDGLLDIAGPAFPQEHADALEAVPAKMFRGEDSQDRQCVCHGQGVYALEPGDEGLRLPCLGSGLL